MAKKNKKMEHKSLSTVGEEKGFWVNNGPVLLSLSELASGVRKLSAEQFSHHVNAEKNDFANWASGVFEDDSLAAKLAGLKSKAAIGKALSQHISELKK